MFGWFMLCARAVMPVGVFQLPGTVPMAVNGAATGPSPWVVVTPARSTCPLGLPWVIDVPSRGFTGSTPRYTVMMSVLGGKVPLAKPNDGAGSLPVAVRRYTVTCGPPVVASATWV